MSKQNILQVVREHKTLFVVIGVLLLLIEIEIFAIAAMKSGKKGTIQVLDTDGQVVYEADGDNLSQFDRYYFEQNFGPLDRYQVRFVSKEVPFPFRAWFAAAIGIPVGAMLLFAFLVRAYLALFYGETAPPPSPAAGAPPGEEGASRFERLLLRLSRFNIFVIGFLILVGIVAYWVVPNLIAYVGRVGIDTLVRYKWLFVALGGVSIVLVAWVVYLRFLLAKKSIESQAELERYRLELAYRAGEDRRLLPGEENGPAMVGWRPEERGGEGVDRRDGTS